MTEDTFDILRAIFNELSDCELEDFQNVINSIQAERLSKKLKK